MLRNINRRSFITAFASGIGTVALSKELIPMVPHSGMKLNLKKNKKIVATTDYFDNIIISKFLFDKKHLDSLHEYLASIGVFRHQWIVDSIWNFYDPTFCNGDFLKQAIDSAHRYGLEFFAQIKPFEGGGFGSSFPSSLPLPEGVAVLKDIRGIFPVARPFVSQNPHLSLKRKLGTYEFNGKVSAIRLIKNDAKPSPIKFEHIELWTSSENNGFVKYIGPVKYRETLEWRSAFPMSKDCRIIHLEGLNLSEGHKYILIKSTLNDRSGNYVNERGSIIEMDDDTGQKIPFILSTGPVRFPSHKEMIERRLYNKITRYFGHPEVKAIFEDETRALKHYHDFYSFDERRQINELYNFAREGYIALACGKPEYMLGNLHPIYPEVRKHWLDKIAYCLEMGADGINIRHSNHTRSPEDWEFGFNDAAIAAAGGRMDYSAIRRVNGTAYTEFLKETRELVKSHGKSLTIHLYSQMLMPDDRSGRSNYIPPNFDWQWETWVRDIADELEFRGAWTLRPENLRQVLETFAAITSDANKPFYFQGNMKELGFKGPFQYRFTKNELDMVHGNSQYNGHVLYETANFTRIKENGELEGSPELKKLLKKYFFTE
jgi:hypothetical protein